MAYGIAIADLQEIVRPLYKYQRGYLLSIGLWELDKNKTNKMAQILYRMNYYHVFVVWIILYLTSMFVEFVRSVGDLQAMIEVFIMLATDTAMFAKFRSFQTKARVYKEMVNDTTLESFRPRDSLEEKILRGGISLATQTTKAYFLTAFLALCTLLLRPILDGSFEVPIAAYFPFDLTNMRTFFIIYTYQCIGLTLQCFVNVTCDTWASSFQIYAATQADILKYRLESLGTSSTDTDVELEDKIKDCIRSHHQLLAFVRKLESGISLPYTVQMFASAIVICVNLYMLSFLSPLDEFSTFFTFLSYQLCMMAQIFIVCYFGNELQYRSNQLGTSLYSANWFGWSQKNKKSLLIMLARFSRPIKMTGLDFFSFDLRAFTSVLNSAYSYFAILKKVNT